MKERKKLSDENLEKVSGGKEYDYVIEWEGVALFGHSSSYSVWLSQEYNYCRTMERRIQDCEEAGNYEEAKRLAHELYDNIDPKWKGERKMIKSGYAQYW